MSTKWQQRFLSGIARPVKTMKNAQQPEIIRGTFYTFEGPNRDQPVLHEYAYVAARATIFDAELVTWANRRDEQLKRRTA